MFCISDLSLLRHIDHFNRGLIFQKPLYDNLLSIPPLSCTSAISDFSLSQAAALQRTFSNPPLCVHVPRPGVGVVRCRGAGLSLCRGHRLPVGTWAQQLGSTGFFTSAQFSELGVCQPNGGEILSCFNLHFPNCGEVAHPFHRFIWFLLQWNVFFCFSTVVFIFLLIRTSLYGF